MALYNEGKFDLAIKQLQGSKEIWSEVGETGTRARLTAHKYLAFSYCVTNRRTQCRQQFVDAFKLDPGFDLDAAERGHPLWGPEFERARKQSAAPATRAPGPTAPGSAPRSGSGQ